MIALSRESRKMEHVSLALQQGKERNTAFDDIVLLHNPIPELNYDELLLNSMIGGLLTSSPIFINAMTGGAHDTLTINQQLAIVARELRIPMAVGSQMAAIKNRDLATTYSIVRKENPNGVIFANLGQEATLDQAQMAIEMIEADAIQIHLNVMQELIMPEGDRDFTGVLQRIASIVDGVEIPVIVKEVGFGISVEAVRQLKNIGVRIIDVGGKGGTNFATIENRRREHAYPIFNNWGIPTPISLLEANQIDGIQLIGSGGIQHGLDVVKSIALGASLVGMAGSFLRVLQKEGISGLKKYIDDLHTQIKIAMMGIGAKDITSIRSKPILISGNTREWCQARGMRIEDLACRGM